MGRTVNSRARAITAADNSSRSRWKSNQRLAQQLQREPTEDYKTIGGLQNCSHGFDPVRHPEHNCRDYENAKRAERGAPPLEP